MINKSFAANKRPSYKSDECGTGPTSHVRHDESDFVLLLQILGHGHQLLDRRAVHLVHRAADGLGRPGMRVIGAPEVEDGGVQRCAGILQVPHGVLVQLRLHAISSWPALHGVSLIHLEVVHVGKVERGVVAEDGGAGDGLGIADAVDVAV